MFCLAIAVHNTGLYLIERNQTREGLKLLNDALKLVRSAVDLSAIDEHNMLNIRRRYREGLAVLSSKPQDKATTDSTFYVVKCHDLNYKNLTRDVMSSKLFVVVQLDEDNSSFENTDMICAVVLQNLASVHAALYANSDLIHGRRSVELLLLSRSLQLKMLERNNEMERHFHSSANISTCCQVDALQLLIITLWRLLELHSLIENNGIVQQMHNDLICARQRFLHVLTRTETLFDVTKICAPCA
jgi:hypothetical protein